jgi:predicted metal-dependent HD superfamily phosphohydrolase
LVQNQTTQTNYRQTFDRFLQNSQNQSIEALIKRYESRDRMDQTYSGQRIEDLKRTFQRMPQTGQRVTVLKQKFEQIDLLERSDGLRNQTRMSPKRDHGQRVRALSQIYERMDSS